MKLTKIKLLSFELPLKKEFLNSQASYSLRRGYIVKLYLDDLCGCGEASPLKHFSYEHLTQILWAFEELKKVLEPNLEYSINELLNLFKVYTKNIPSLNFALDIALYDILSKKNIYSNLC